MHILIDAVNNMQEICQICVVILVFIRISIKSPLIPWIPAVFLFHLVYPLQL